MYKCVVVFALPFRFSLTRFILSDMGVLWSDFEPKYFLSDHSFFWRDPSLWSLLCTNSELFIYEEYIFSIRYNVQCTCMTLHGLLNDPTIWQSCLQSLYFKKGIELGHTLQLAGHQEGFISNHGASTSPVDLTLTFLVKCHIKVPLVEPLYRRES